MQHSIRRAKRRQGEVVVWKPVKPTTIDGNLMPRVVNVVRRLEDGKVVIRAGSAKTRTVDASEIIRPATPREIELGFVP